MKTLASLIRFPKIENSNGVLSVYQAGDHVPFDIRRIFTVSAGEGSIRGNHAHKACTQLLVCTHGKIRVTCDDGSTEEHCDLDDTGLGLLIPPGIWARQQYVTDDAVLMVLCDLGYEESDYLRDYDAFLRFVASASRDRRT